jgi:hypothetical protein
MVHNQPKSNLLNKPKSDAQTNNPSTACFWFALPPKFVFFNSLFFLFSTVFQWLLVPFYLVWRHCFLSLSSPHVMHLSTCFSVVLLLLFVWFMTWILNHFEVHIRHTSFLFFAYVTFLIYKCRIFIDHLSHNSW